MPYQQYNPTIKDYISRTGDEYSLMTSAFKMIVKESDNTIDTEFYGRLDGSGNLHVSGTLTRTNAFSAGDYVLSVLAKDLKNIKFENGAFVCTMLALAGSVVSVVSFNYSQSADSGNLDFYIQNSGLTGDKLTMSGLAASPVIKNFI